MQAARELRSYGVACCVLLLAAAPAACGEETGSGVDSSKTFDELSNQELTTICEWAVNLVSVEDLITYGCYITALMGSGKDREQCEVVAAECVEDSEANADDLSCMFNDDLTGCASEITVGQLEACFRAQFSLLSDIAREISCNSVLEEVDLTQIELPAPCRVITESCPGTGSGPGARLSRPTR